MSIPYFNEKMKLAGLIAANHNIILLLPRFGISLGFGDKSVREVCATSNVPVDFMLHICNLYTFDDYTIDKETIRNTDMSMLIPYLKASHRYYISERLPHIEKHLLHIADSVDPHYGNVLKKFYADYQHEIAEHFRCEEEFDFPYLLRLQQGQPGSVSVVSHYEDSHLSLVDKLSDLPQIVYKYLPGNELPEETMELVFDILQLTVDIQKHVLIEDKIMLPYLELLEKESL